MHLIAFYTLPVYAKVVLWFANLTTALLYLCRYSETLRRTIGNEIIQLYYNATLSKLTRILDELEGIDTISCNIGKINIVLVESAKTDLFLEIIHAGTLIYGGERWGCTDLKKEIKPIYARVTGATAKGSSLDVEVVYVDPLSLFDHFDLQMKVESIANEIASKRQLDISESGTLDQITPMTFNFSGDIFEKMNEQGFPYFCPNCSMRMDAYLDFSSSELYTNFKGGLDLEQGSFQVVMSSWLSLKGKRPNQIDSQIMAKFPPGRAFSRDKTQLNLLPPSLVPSLTFTAVVALTFTAVVGGVITKRFEAFLWMNATFTFDFESSGFPTTLVQACLSKP